MAKSELGTKRECPECAVKYYDLGRSPCVCPKCSATFELEVAPPSRAVKVEKPAVVKKAETSQTSEDKKTISLDELGAEEQSGEENMADSDEAALADIDIPDEENDDDDDDSESSDVFLDTEDDENADVSGLLGTGIGKGNDEG